jgi:hypothetical protein
MRGSNDIVPFGQALLKYTLSRGVRKVIKGINTACIECVWLHGPLPEPDRASGSTKILPRHAIICITLTTERVP